MIVDIDRLEALCGTSTPRPWWTDAETPGTGSWPYLITTLEGGIVAGDIEGAGDVVLIVTAINALPDLLEMARALQRYGAHAHDCAWWTCVRKVGEASPGDEAIAAVGRTVRNGCPPCDCGWEATRRKLVDGTVPDRSGTPPSGILKS